MKDFFKDLTGSINAGLVSDDRFSVNTAGLVQCKNVAIVTVGDKIVAATFIPPTTGLDEVLGDEGVVKEHPWPQVFKGRTSLYLVTEDVLYTVDPSTLALSEVVVNDFIDRDSVGFVEPGGCWHFADFGEVFALFNGSNVIFRENRSGMLGGSDKTFVTSRITISSGCAFNGRLVMGGFDVDDFFWFWRAGLMNSTNSFGALFKYTAPGPAFVCWSQIGSDLFWILHPEDFTGDNAQRLKDMLERNEMGFVPMNWNGSVLSTLAFGDFVVVGGTGGVSAIKQAGSTFALRDIYPLGVGGRGCACAGLDSFIFIDSLGCLYSVDKQLNLSKVGYKYLLSTLTLANVTITYDPTNDRFYISDGIKGFCYHNGRLFETSLRLISGVEIGGSFVGIYSVDSDDILDVDEEFYDEYVGYAQLVSYPFNFGFNGIKTVESVNTGMYSTKKVLVALDWRMSTADEWKRSRFSPANSEGVAFVRVSGVEFRLVIWAVDYTVVDFDSCLVYFKYADQRYLRGVSDEYVKGGAGV